MRREPDASADPYRTLGLEPGASMAEVKRAYRLLAKAFHPDSGGEAAVPRFLAIQDAYEQLKTGKIFPGARAPRPPAQPAAEPWRADPARAQAARERARTARGTRARAAGSTGAPAGGTAGSSGGPASGTAGSGGPAGARGSRPSGPRTGTSSSGTRSGRRRDVRKATMGSTSYDEARDTNDATWSGASWYGPSSGEYWIVNPREYADPRKHGPEYQQRARRPLEGDAAGSGAEPLEPARAEAAAAREARRHAAQAHGPATGEPAWRTTTASADAASARAASAGTAARPAAWPASRATSSSARPRVEPTTAAPSRDAFQDRPGEAAPDADRIEAIGAASRAWLGGSTDDPVRRLGLALVAWPPIGLAAAAAIGEATGCTQYAAACGGAEPLLPWLAQAAILGLLLLLPPIARLLAGGAIGVLIALVPITAFLIAVGGSGAPQAGFVMAFLLGVAWLVGVAWSARSFRRPVGAGAIP